MTDLTDHYDTDDDAESDGTIRCDNRLDALQLAATTEAEARDVADETTTTRLRHPRTRRGVELQVRLVDYNRRDDHGNPHAYLNKQHFTNYELAAMTHQDCADHALRLGATAVHDAFCEDPETGPDTETTDEADR